MNNSPAHFRINYLSRPCRESVYENPNAEAIKAVIKAERSKHDTKEAVHKEWANGDVLDQWFAFSEDGESVFYYNVKMGTKAVDPPHVAELALHTIADAISGKVAVGETSSTQVVESFRVLDKDDSGTLAGEELISVLHEACGMEGTVAEEAFAQADSNGDGEVHCRFCGHVAAWSFTERARV